MFKHLFAALAAACLLLVVLWAFGAATPIPKPIGWAVLLAIGLWAAWPLIRHARGRILAVLGLGALAMSLSACNTLGGLGSPMGGSSPKQVLDTLDQINDAAAKHCTGAGHIAWNPPFPPTGSMNLDCYIGAVPVVGGGGTFGGAGASVAIVPLSQLNSLLAAQPAAAAAAPAKP